jgi:hypothetical protein
MRGRDIHFLIANEKMSLIHNLLNSKLPRCTHVLPVFTAQPGNIGHYFCTLILYPLGLILAESDVRAAKIKGNVVNSKYVTITDHRYQHGDVSDVITGIVRNNSTQEIPMISVIAVLYDKDNNLITTGIGSADAQDLPEGDNSTFSIHFVLRDNAVYSYTLFPGGIPQLP